MYTFEIQEYKSIYIFWLPWRNRLARSAVNRKVSGSSPAGSAILFILTFSQLRYFYFNIFTFSELRDATSRCLDIVIAQQGTLRQVDLAEQKNHSCICCYYLLSVQKLQLAIID